MELTFYAGVEKCVERCYITLVHVHFTEIFYMNTDYENMTMPQLAKELAVAKWELEQITARKVEQQKLVDHLSMRVIPDKMMEQGVTNITVAGVGRLQTRSDIRCSVKMGNRDNLHEWMRNNGMEEMLQETIAPSTLKAWVRECIAEGLEYPEELLEITPYTRASVVGADKA